MVYRFASTGDGSTGGTNWCHEIQPFRVSAAVLICYIDSIAIVRIRIMETFVAIPEVIFAKVVRWIDVDHVNLTCIAGFQRC